MNFMALDIEAWFYKIMLHGISAAPVFTMERQVKAATIGSRVTLTCQAYGNPPPTVTWTKRRGDLPELVYMLFFFSQASQ